MRLTTEMRNGVRVGVDVGTVRVGVAASDAAGVLASPVAVLARDARGRRDLDDLEALVAEREAIEGVVGLPRHLRGAEGACAAPVRHLAAALPSRVSSVP